jgi:hypothetical protein
MTAQAAAKMNPEEFYKTEDMAMVTFLRMQSHAVQSVEWEGGHTCYWMFRVTDALLDATEDFLDGSATVEPREFSKKFSQTKKEFYDAAGRAGVVLYRGEPK